MTRAEKLTRVRKRLIETARPELIDETIQRLTGVYNGTTGLSRGVIAYALAKCRMRPARVVTLRRRWLRGGGFEDSFLQFVLKETR